jgi:hypothetical protein
MKTTAHNVTLPQPEPHDTAKTGTPDPSWPVEKQLHWLHVYSHVLLLNCSERVRVAAAKAADREAAS